MQAWQDIGWFGVRYPVYDAPWWNVPVWDTSGCCSSDITSNKFFGLMNALFGYSVRRPTPKPNHIQCLPSVGRGMRSEA